ncbi:hypothetical protein BJV82DRAFT_111021 [Fennellomyces sp. T-0311]|nr:hypothetical protein BJV82DRAFT_111021 [Fennellomyces sp. T-0311]
MATAKIDTVADAEITVDKNLGFIGALPGDIVLKIFSHVSQQDCLTCMATCRAWDRAIPEYSQLTWKKLVIEPSDTYKNGQRRERCLGSHVKQVDIYATEESQLYLLMQRLVNWGCTEIESLELRMHRFTVDQDACIAALRKLAPDLVHLLIAGSQSMTLLPYILNTYPELTYFKSRRTGGLQHRNLTTIPIYRDTKIQYMHLDYPMDKAQLECTLPKCPNLRCFGIDQKFLGPFHSRSFDLDLLFTWCPKITYLSTNFVSNYGQFENAGDYMSDHVGIRYVNITDHYSRDQLARFLEQSQNTLEVLAITK